MKTSTLITCTLAAAFAGGCARTSADNVQPVEEPTRPEAAGADTSLTRPMTVSGIYLDADLAAACNITTPKAFFEFDSANVDTQANDTLRDVATCLTTGPMRGRQIELVGHADPRGTDAYNQQLGKSRADSVRDYLQVQGVPQTNLVSRSMGEQGADPTDPSEWPYDRRVDIRLASGGTSGADAMSGTGAAGTGAAGTGASATGATGTGASGTGASGTGASATGASGTGGTSKTGKTSKTGASGSATISAGDGR